MHHHLEIVMPPVDDVEAAVTSIMAPFDENGTDEDGDENPHAFWDFWVIGGRWAGAKLKSRLGKDRIDAFCKMLSDEGVTVSSLTMGKQVLSPASQIPKVDQWWREWFPESGVYVCPLFQHSNDQFSSDDTLPGDVARFSETPLTLTCDHLIFAGPSFDGEGWGGPLKANDMLQCTVWNGCTHLETTWDGTLQGALAWLDRKLGRYRQEYAELCTPQPDWLVVTVDYHS